MCVFPPLFSKDFRGSAKRETLAFLGKKPLLFQKSKEWRVRVGLSRFFWDFPDLSGDSPGIFPICPFPLSRPINSTYEEQSRKGPRHNLDLSRKKRETPRFGNPPGLASPKKFRACNSSGFRGVLGGWDFLNVRTNFSLALCCVLI